MKQETANNKLNDAMLVLQQKQSDELILLKQQFHLTYQSLKPINIIKSTFQEIAQVPEIRNNIAENLIGLSTGYITKKVLVGTTGNPIKTLFGTIVQFAVTNFVSKNLEGIKTVARNLRQNMLKVKYNTKQKHHQNGNS